MKTYTVFGVYEDNGQSWGQDVEASDEGEAAVKACQTLIESNAGAVQASDMLVVCVLEGLQVNLFDGAGHASDLGVEDYDDENDDDDLTDLLEEQEEDEDEEEEEPLKKAGA